jgi:hypothetical protein
MNQDPLSETASNPCSPAISESYVAHPRSFIHEASAGTGRAHNSTVTQDWEHQQLDSDEQQGREQDAVAGVDQCNNIASPQFGEGQDISFADGRAFLDHPDFDQFLVNTDRIFDKEYFDF